MHVLFCHSQFPAQFGFFAHHAAEHLGWRCSFVCERPARLKTKVDIITYKKGFGATQHHSYFSRGFENAAAQYEAVFRTLKARSDIRPDLIVGHAGLGGALFLRELYDVPMLSFFEYYYHLHDSDMDFRPDFPPSEASRLRLMLRNAPLLVELQDCDQGYCPTRFQRSLFPSEYQAKLHTVFDGIDTSIWRPRDDATRTWQGRSIDPRTRIVTYCSRGFESMRGFDIFMRAAKLIYQQYPDVVFLVVGTDRICYGGDERFIAPHATFKQFVLSKDQYDLSKFLFLGQLAIGELAKVLSIGDAHIYLTAPFVLSWSMLNAMACGAVVVGSRTKPVLEVVEHGRTGLLADFFSPQEVADQVLGVLKRPEDFVAMRRAAVDLIGDEYSTAVTYPKLAELCTQVARGEFPRQSHSAPTMAASQTTRTLERIS